jgi:hypothetical protein
MYVCKYMSTRLHNTYTLCVFASRVVASGVSPGLRAAQPVYRDDPAGYRTAHLICT